MSVHKYNLVLTVTGSMIFIRKNWKLNPSRNSGIRHVGDWMRFLGAVTLLCFCSCLSTASPGSEANIQLLGCQPEQIKTGYRPALLLQTTHLEEEAGTLYRCLLACCRSSMCDAAWFIHEKCVLLHCQTSLRCRSVKTNQTASVFILLNKQRLGGQILDVQSGRGEKALLHHLQGKSRTLNVQNGTRTSDGKGWDLQQAAPKEYKDKSIYNSDGITPPDSKQKWTEITDIRKPGGRLNSGILKFNRYKHHQLYRRALTKREPPKGVTNISSLVNATEDSAARHLPKVSSLVAELNSSSLVTLPTPRTHTLSSVQHADNSNYTVKILNHTIKGNTSKPKPSPYPEAVADKQEKNASHPPIATTVLIPAANLSLSNVTAVIPVIIPTVDITDIQPDVKELVVSAGNNVEMTLPNNKVDLNAFVLPEAQAGTSYSYDWKLITHPTDYEGEMEGKHSKTLKLSKLTVGLYEFEVTVDGENAHGEGFVNVTVNPVPRVNQPPVAIVSPEYQEISLPTTSTVIDGSQSKDDDKIVSYHWEEVKGPLRDEKVSVDTAILKLTNLVPGNYTFSLTVVDSDGDKDSATASLTVNKAVDYPPVANAGPNQVITLPHNSITLYGNQSTDDHGILSYEWLLSPNSKGKVVEMQGVRTSTLQLSAMQEGDYTFQLTVTDSAGQQSNAEVTVIVQPENNKPPVADSGPDKELTLPVDSTMLDGSKSSDDQNIVSYLWEKTKGPDGVKIENANSAVATVTGLQSGAYEFTLTVKDERNLQSQSTVSVIVKEEMNKPPVAKIAGNVVITLPVNTATLDGSKSSDDKGIISYHWIRDEGSPAAGDVLNGSDHQAVLLISNLVEGTYTFLLKVTDANGESDSDRATLEVKGDPRKENLVEIITDVSASRMTERQKGMLIRQIGVLLGVLDSDIIVQKIHPYTEQSTKIVFFVKNEQAHQIFKGQDIASTLQNKLRKQKSDFLIFRALQVDTVTCQLNCSGHGQCDSFTKRCICDPFWMENFFRVQLSDGESNCEWSVLYVTISSFVIVVAFGILSWAVVCCCKRRKGKPKRKSRYKILNAMDDLESIELKQNAKGDDLFGVYRKQHSIQ
ncbi:dyslexia-associated protein KIAA0319-like protein homolog isoform X2 [Protopterus annectens]|uniref:dyslexia-associated protein KIAA0319-like protein homolog isoform X2 n=1 Tax=Protopterus annectens TaxID=7888 RepID=UPI001CFBECDA|nr:dyslexia-associated protein KIAA0319-like protein homolog isoform X2 [Protopterus annectens]